MYANDLAAAAGNYGHLFVAGYIYVSTSPPAQSASGWVMALFKSTDSGGTWTDSNVTNLGTHGNSYGYAVAVNPQDENIVYVGGYIQLPSIHGVVFKSVNGGSFWTDVTGAIQGDVNALATDPTDGNRVYAGTDSGLFRSDNAGSSWTKVSTRLVSTIVINRNATAEIYIGGYNGVFFSPDRGTTWSDFNTGLSDIVQWLSHDPANRFLYAASQNSGVYKSAISVTYTLTIAAGAGGTTSPAPGTTTYTEGTSVQITATANAGYRFTGWSGDATGTTNPLTVVMNANKSVTANFAAVGNYTLTIAAGAGGTTSPAPGTTTYTEGTSVQITATPNVNYRFSGWSGDASGTTNPLTVVMDANKSITANFERSQYTLTVAAGAGGTTSPAPGTTTQAAGASVQVTAIPNANYSFTGWSGDATGTANPLTVVMNADKSITAAFQRAIYAPLDFAGTKLVNRILFRIQYINHLTWRANPDNANIAKHKLYLVDGGTKTLLAEIPAETSEYDHKGMTKAKEYTYVLTAVNSEGREGPAATAIVK